MSIPGAANPLLLATAAAGGYQISRSLRFNSSDSAFCSRTPASAGNRKTWTWAGWVKRCKSGNEDRLLYAGSITYLQFTDNVSDALTIANFNGSAHDWRLTTSRLFRDFSAWYHIVIAFDTTQSTASNRIKIYVNGVQETAFATSTYPNQNTEWAINNNIAHNICGAAGGSNFANLYLADIHFIDGQALTPSSFTEVSATTGQLIPKAYTGTFGTNGFWLKFSDNSAATATTLGKDYSGNSNNWTPNNLSVTAGAGNDSLVDTPTSGSQVDTGLGGQVTGNYCTLNPLSGASSHPLGNGNLEKISTSGSGNRFGTIGITSGKFYWENAFTVIGSAVASCGISSNGRDTNNISELKVYETYGTKYNGSSSSAYGASWGANDVIGVAFDADNGTLAFYKNGVSQGTAFTGLTGLTWFPVFRDDGGYSGWINFGQRPFAYTAPSGFKALCDTNLPAPVVAKPSTVMDVKLYTGNGGTNSITGLSFSPDLVWLKNRSGGGRHNLYDVIRDRKALFSDGTDAELSLTAGNDFGTFDSSGFTLLTPQSTAINNSGQTFVAWTWDAGSSTVTNTQGSITSQVRANPSAGFSIVTYTGAGSTSSTIGHGLGVAPSFIITKARTTAAQVNSWRCYHRSLGSTQYIELSSTTAANTFTDWANTSPTSTLFYVGGTNTTFPANESGINYVAYCFAPVAGYSSFGSYTGNGSTDGPFVYTGFRPRWIMLKRTDSPSSWAIMDTLRLGYNVRNDSLYANLSDAEANFGLIDVLSNGFKLRATFASENGGTHIYAAFAESPFQYARAR